MRKIIRRLLCAALALVLVAPAMIALPAIADDREDGIQMVINKQLEAFRRGDSAAAWAVAAPNIQSRFGTQERFMEMVRNYYPQIMNSKSTTFKGLREIEGNLIQRVFVEGGPGDFVDAYYTMEFVEGMWRISSVYVTKPKGEGA